MIIHGFPPVSKKDARLLILGSMPGGESLRRKEYYAHPMNTFWMIMGKILDVSEKTSYEERLEILKQRKIALWDVVKSCERNGSGDSEIKKVRCNDFRKFFRNHSCLSAIFFNGQMAHKLFMKHASALLKPEIRVIVLPSTSPANASISIKQKTAKWNKEISASGNFFRTKVVPPPQGYGVAGRSQ